MTYAVRCIKTGMIDFVDGPGLHACSCGKRHLAYQAGLPPKEAGLANIVPDKIAKYHDWSLGCDITSRSQRNKLDAAKDLRRLSHKEYYRKYGLGNEKRGVGYFYPGQKNHKSTAEKYKNQ